MNEGEHQSNENYDTKWKIICINLNKHEKSRHNKRSKIETSEVETNKH